MVIPHYFHRIGVGEISSMKEPHLLCCYRRCLFSRWYKTMHSRNNPATFYIKKYSQTGPQKSPAGAGTRYKVFWGFKYHYKDVIMRAMASQITSVSVVCAAVCSGADQRKHQSSASLAFVREIHRWPVDSPYKWPVMRNMFPFDDVIMPTGSSYLFLLRCM